jgi:alanine racemase
MVDITDLPPVRPGDEVVLLGRQGDEMISADELAKWLETISYEVLCLLGTFNEKFYI